MTTVLVIALVLLLLSLVGLLFRILILRIEGIQVVFRMLPAESASSWHYGTMRYRSDQLLLYKLGSLRPGPNLRLRRCALTLQDRRLPVREESDLLSGEFVIVDLIQQDTCAESMQHPSAQHFPQQCVAIAMDKETSSAFQSWVESSPSARHERFRQMH